MTHPFNTTSAVSVSASLIVPAWSPPLTTGTYITGEHICPDGLMLQQIGPADCWRGRVVRGVFWFLRAWPVKR